MAITELVRILDADPALGEGLSPERREAARRHLVAEVVTVPAGGSMTDIADGDAAERLLGLLVLDGLLLRRVHLVGQTGAELLGAGDVVRPWQTESDIASVPAAVEWKVYEPTLVAILGEELQAALCRCPAVMRRIFARAVQRSNSLALNLVLAQLPRIEARLLVLFWHLADRFGHVDPHGVVVPLRLSHQTLADLVYARRPSVSTALKRLDHQGLLVRHPGGRWTLHGEPPGEALRLTADRPAPSSMVTAP